VVEKAFSGLSPNQGYNGDEDQGLMGSLAVLMKIGLFEMKSGNEIQPVIELGSPVFDKIVINLNQDYYPGDKIIITAENNEFQNPYIQSVNLNDSILESQFLDFHTLVKGAKLKLVMGDTPNKEWGE
jgi:putative alpha-1,2-mannosidase